MTPIDLSKRIDLSKCGDPFRLRGRKRRGRILATLAIGASLLTLTTSDTQAKAGQQERRFFATQEARSYDGGVRYVKFKYVLATVVALTSSTSYTKPADWNNGANTIEMIGGGASGTTGWNCTCFGNSGGGGGGGGGYSKTNNVTISGATAAYTIGGVGGTTTFAGATSATGGSGGTAGTGTFSGGAGGATPGSWGQPGAGGGGAGGLHAAGVAGGSNAGGRGDGTFGGTGGASGAAAGSAGTEWTSWGSGGGGAGANAGGSVGGAGGLYGGGGGGAYAPGPAGGAGAQGLIIITYTPASALGLRRRQYLRR